MTIVARERMPVAEPVTATPTGQLIALVPAFNEAGCIAATVEALRQQTWPVSRIIVIDDNCTDDTGAIAMQAGAEALATVGNTKKKAGALNQALAAVLPDLADDDYVFIQDADTVVVPDFIELAMAAMRSDPRAVVCGRYACKAEHGLIGLLQRNEFFRSGRQIDRRQDRTHILVGTSTLLHAGILRHVLAAREQGILPAADDVYTDSITEDFELSLAIKTLGYRLTSPHGCDAITDVMPTVAKLWHQRLRWYRGGIEDLRRYGLNRVTLGYWRRQAVIISGIAAQGLYIGAVAASLSFTGSLHLTLIWSLVTLLFMTDRVINVWKAGRMARLVAGLLIIEMAYDYWQQAVYVTAWWKALRGRQAEWRAT